MGMLPRRGDGAVTPNSKQQKKGTGRAYGGLNGGLVWKDSEAGAIWGCDEARQANRTMTREKSTVSPLTPAISAARPALVGSAPLVPYHSPTLSSFSRTGLARWSHKVAAVKGKARARVWPSGLYSHGYPWRWADGDRSRGDTCYRSEGQG
jgi:hypothetical protein